MDEKKAKMMATLEKMLRLAMDPGATIGEKETAERKASEIMLKYKIDRSELSLKESTDPDAGMGKDACVIIDKQATWIFTLVSCLSKTFECQALQDITWGSSGRRKELRSFMIFGEKDDVQTVKELFNRIQLHITWAAYAHLGKNAGKRPLRAFCQGAVDRVAYRLLAMYQNIQNISSECRDLVIVKRKKAAEYMNREVGPTTKGRKHRNDAGRDHVSEYLAGTKAGNSIDIGNSSKRGRVEV